MNYKDYLQWILDQKAEDFQISQENEDTIRIEDDYLEGEVTIYHLEMEVVQLRLSCKSDGENIFFLHFELKDEEHAKGLFREMLTCLREQKNRQTKEILLCCSSGITTSYFAEKLNEAAASFSLDMHFSAVSFSRFYEKAGQSDAILLAPQISYELDKIRKILNDKIVLSIPGKMFASYDAVSLIGLIQEELKKEKEVIKKKEILEAIRKIENDTCIFVINMTNDTTSVRYISRLYARGKVVENEEIIKQTPSFQDIRDIMDTTLSELRKKYAIDAVAMSIPSAFSTNSGKQCIKYKDFADQLSKEYDIPVFAQHNTSAVVYGYYVMQDKYENISYHSQPRGAMIGGQGMVYHGIPITGSRHRAGEVETVYPRFFPDQPEETYSATAQDMLDALVCYLLTNITIMDPEAILIRSELTPDMDEVRKELSRYMDPENIPDLIYVRDISEYACLGTMLYGVYKLQEKKQ